MKYATQKLTQSTTQTQNIPTNRILIVDCSGSMLHELPKLRKHLKNKLPTLISVEDTLTLIWFSGKNQYGVIFEDFSISSSKDLQSVNSAIDRFLVPVGMTGFVQPLQEALKCIDRSSLSNYTLTFMTDGYDNAWSHNQILEACDQLSDKISSATFVEYSYYADHNMLQKMSESVSGSVILAEDFTKYEETLESVIKGKSVGKKIVMDGPKSLSTGFEFVVGTTPAGFVISVPTSNKTISLPADTTHISYFTGTGALDEIDDLLQSAYGVAALVQKGMANIALELASVIGDVTLYKKLENSFSKQDYARIVEIASMYGSGIRNMFVESERNTNLIPDPNAYNVLELLMDLADQEGNYLDLSHPEFKYNSISDYSETKADDSGYIPVFTDNPGQVKASISSLKFNEDRPNISILVKRGGTVNLPQNTFGFGESFETYIWRNYTIVRDGIVNLKTLPVILSRATYDLMVNNGAISKTETYQVGKTFLIDTTQFPVINRSFVTPITSREFFDKNFELYKAQCLQKVANADNPKDPVGAKFASLYGEDGATFLKSIGISEGGFSPAKTTIKSEDVYVGKVLEVKMSGLSTIPKIDDVKKAIESGKKLTPSQKCLSDAIDFYSKLNKGDGKEFAADAKNCVKALREEIIKIKFGIILGKTWFTDMSDIDDNTREIDYSIGKPIKCSVILSDKEI